MGCKKLSPVLKQFPGRVARLRLHKWTWSNFPSRKEILSRERRFLPFLPERRVFRSLFEADDPRDNRPRWHLTGYIRSRFLPPCVESCALPAAPALPPSLRSERAASARFPSPSPTHVSPPTKHASIINYRKLRNVAKLLALADSSSSPSPVAF